MKKLAIFSILFGMFLLGFFMGCADNPVMPIEDEQPVDPVDTTSVDTTTYALNVLNGTGTGEYAVDETAEIVSNVYLDSTFAVWEAIPDSLVDHIADTTSATTMVTMPAADLTVIARFVVKDTTTQEPIITEPTNAYGHFSVGQYTRKLELSPTGEFFNGYKWMFIGGENMASENYEVYPGFSMDWPDNADWINFGFTEDDTSWYFPGRGNCTLDADSVEWDNGRYWPWEKLNPVPSGLSGSMCFDPQTRIIRFSGNLFNVYNRAFFNHSSQDAYQPHIYDGCELTVPDHYQVVQVYFVMNGDTTWWYFNDDGSGRDDNEFSYCGMEWRVDGQESWFWLDEYVPNKAYVKFTPVNPYDMDIILNGVSVNSNTVYECNIGHNSIGARRVGYYDYSNSFTGVAGDTIIMSLTLTAETPPPPTSNLRVEFSSDKMRLYGDGRENWLGAECYDPDQNESTGWLNNLWVHGVTKSDHIEFTISDNRYDHVVLWKDAVNGEEGSGGSGVEPRFPDHTTIEAGSGISNIQKGFIVLNR